MVLNFLSLFSYSNIHPTEKDEGWVDVAELVNGLFLVQPWRQWRLVGHRYRTTEIEAQSQWGIALRLLVSK